MRRGFFLVATQHRAPKIYQRFWTIPFLSIHGCGSLNFNLSWKEFDCYVDFFVLNEMEATLEVLIKIVCNVEKIMFW